MGQTPSEQLLEIRTNEKVPWSVLFQRIEALDKEIGFERVLASDNTLEQLFIGFAEKAEKEKELEANKPSAVPTPSVSTAEPQAEV
ncbi:hypothetical protein HPB50_002776 [Hyalomma asiaticum]|uniref:Uncharacterized protein n=1 Tax=Hyalomma asiaticum TaxID=266040 RepID=A0ACB7S7B8_HYAAI|nr:hypothetical protein HPB50_002776 [Hyalomma asiaticum]